MNAACPLCQSQDETVLWRDTRLRVILVGDRDYPSFCRVVWGTHAREMTDLPDDARRHFMAAVFAVEQSLRDMLAPEKINLASLGNQVPHLHWHVIARFADDAHFPDPIWAPRRRDGVAHAVDRNGLAAKLQARLGPFIPTK